MLNWSEGVDYQVDANGCWIWLGYCNASGTPMRSGMSARRFAYIKTKGDPGTQRVFSHCGQPKCVRPSHTTKGTHATVLNNSIRSVAPPDVREDIALDIRCGLTAAQIADKHGLTKYYARNVRAKIANQLRKKNAH